MRFLNFLELNRILFAAPKKGAAPQTEGSVYSVD
jgi:hypothetical protein